MICRGFRERMLADPGFLVKVGIEVRLPVESFHSLVLTASVLIQQSRYAGQSWTCRNKRLNASHRASGLQRLITVVVIKPITCIHAPARGKEECVQSYHNLRDSC